MKTLMNSGGAIVIIMMRSDSASDTTNILDGVRRVFTLKGVDQSIARLCRVVQAQLCSLGTGEKLHHCIGVKMNF